MIAATFARRTSIALAAYLTATLCGCSSQRAERGGAAAPSAAATDITKAEAASVERAARSIADEFITTFWCGPPLHFFDDDRAREIAEAGFNLVGATCEGPVNPQLNAAALRVAHRHGLRMLIKDQRISAHQPVAEGWQARADEALAAYRDLPGLAGYFLLDEPSNGSIYPDIAALRQRIRRRDPSLIGYVNLLPDYVFAGPEDYRDYVESYLFRTRPELLSYDHYPFLIGSDRPSFFDNLALIRELALEYEVPFMLIVQLMPHAEYRDPTPAELGWQVYHALAFGARGISYFAYWTPTQVPDNIAYRFRGAIIEGGMRTRHYDEVKVLNRCLRAIAEELDGFRSVGVWDSQGEFGIAEKPEPIAAVAAGDIVAGVFRDTAGRSATLLVNRGYRDAARVELGPSSDGRVVEVFDPQSGSWATTGPSIDLPAGEAKLVRH